MLPLVKVGMPDKDILIPRIEEVLYSGFIAEGKLYMNLKGVSESIFH